VLEYGHLYAPLTMLDDRNRRIMFGWVREHRSEDEQRRAGWSGAQSIPRVLTLDEQRRVIMTPVEEFAHIRGTHHRAEALDVAGITPLNIAGLALELSAEFEVAPDGECGIGLNYAADSQERTEIVYRAADQRLIVRKLSAEDGSVAHLYEAAHPLDRGESLRLHILFDHSVVEVIANGRTSIVSRTYPVELHNGVCVLGEKARLVSLDAWEMPRVVD
jgi:beta-fructofuranosidase